MIERSELITWIRGELVGPSQPLADPVLVTFAERDFNDTVSNRRGPLGWIPEQNGDIQEVLFYERESPHRKYGAGLLHPVGSGLTHPTPDSAAADATDPIGADAENAEAEAEQNADKNLPVEGATGDLDDFEVTSPDVRHPSTIGVTFCVRLEERGRIAVRLPRRRKFFWQAPESKPFLLNGRYENCKRRWSDDSGSHEAPIWRRLFAIQENTAVIFPVAEFVDGRKVRKAVPNAAGSPLLLYVELFPRRLEMEWLVTVVLRNETPTAGTQPSRESILYQTYFEAEVESSGALQKYPESRRPFSHLDTDEQSLALLYRDSATWAIGHGCAAGWDAEPGQTPHCIFADVMPAVELPSMTPDIRNAEGNRIQLSMRSLAALSDDGGGEAWESLNNLRIEYGYWIRDKRREANDLPENLRQVANNHLAGCEICLVRINSGLDLLRSNNQIRHAFRLANLAMLLQQIATKQLPRRPLERQANAPWVAPSGTYNSPWSIYAEKKENAGLGTWRAFQIAFLLMSLKGVSEHSASDWIDEREIVDLIWFPTGGGKTEAYLGVVAYYLFHQRLTTDNSNTIRPDGTNVLMRYTLRMLTTQQFQRAASLICAMEYLRRNPARHRMGEIGGARFSLGLWIGSGGSPNDIKAAKIELSRFRRGDVPGNPLVLTECPWCRAEIGRFDGQRPNKVPQNQWSAVRTRGISEESTEGPLLHCTDSTCCFGDEQWQNWLPVEVIDERIYKNPPSLVIATADKLAMMAYRESAGAIFGRQFHGGEPRQTHKPPGLIIQDELHLISGPLGTMYSLYEGIFERFCSVESEGRIIKPKLVASTATIRGASEQVRSVYARKETHLFPTPGISMADSFFGKYARSEPGDAGKLLSGRLYLGVHASDYGSVLTAQVRTFSSALFRPFSFAHDRRDAWWTLLAFYNSLRELGGAKTLFDSDIRSRLKFIFNREGFPHDSRRHLRIVEELTSRLSQSEIVGMMDQLSKTYHPDDKTVVDACLASNIIEVGVDIDRLSLMGVVGQPKTTATYIQVTGRVGRKWWDRPGLILTIYNPSKSRDRSHFEQFHSYHRRLYERVEPTSATPFAISAIQRGLAGALIAWARQFTDAEVHDDAAYSDAVESGYQLLRERCALVQAPEDRDRSLEELERVRDQLLHKWSLNPQKWEEFPPQIDGEYLMLWPGQFATRRQKDRGVTVPSSMRQVDGSAELSISQGFGSVAAASPQSTAPPANP